MIAVTVPLSNGRSRIDYIYFMEQVLLAPKTGQSKAILSRRFALFISFNWTLQLQWDQEFITIWNTKMKICLSYRILKMKKVLRFRHPQVLAPDHDMKKPIKC